MFMCLAIIVVVMLLFSSDVLPVSKNTTVSGSGDFISIEMSISVEAKPIENK